MQTNTSSINPQGHPLSVEYCPVERLKPFRRNARTHTKGQINKIADSIQVFGFTNPILVDQNNTVIAGHGRLDAAKKLGLVEVPVICLADMDEGQVRAYILADNRLAELAGWDNDILATELQYLLEVDLSFDIGVIGFETPEIDLIIEPVSPVTDENTESLIPEVSENPISRVGDIWHLGPHRLMCGDALKLDHLSMLMGDVKANLVFTDPPYNVPIHGHVGGMGQIQHSEFVMASGEMSEQEFTTFLSSSLNNLADQVDDGAVMFVCMDWRHMFELMQAGRAVELSLVNMCVWNKDNGGMGSLYRSKHELIFVFKKGTVPHTNNVLLSKYGRYRTNVWDYPGVNTFRQGRLDELALHPTVKPLNLIKDAILDVTHHGEVVLDVFGGAGTTLLAADSCGRRARVMELDPLYVDVTIKRWQAATGESAIHAETGLPFEHMT